MQSKMLVNVPYLKPKRSQAETHTIIHLPIEKSQHSLGKACVALEGDDATILAGGERGR